MVGSVFNVFVFFNNCCLKQNVIGLALVCGVLVAADVSHLESGYDYHPAFPAFEEQPRMEYIHLDISDEDRVPMAPLDDFVDDVTTRLSENEIEGRNDGITPNEVNVESQEPGISSRLEISDDNSEEGTTEHQNHDDSNSEGSEGMPEDPTTPKIEDNENHDDSPVISTKIGILEDEQDTHPTTEETHTDNEIPGQFDKEAVEKEEQPEEVPTKPEEPEIIEREPDFLSTPIDDENIVEQLNVSKSFEENLIPHGESEGFNGNIDTEEIPGHTLTDTGYVYRDPRNRY
ncbi:hypothetical protein ACFFRR_004475 [Megaselia abdita]